MMDRSLILVQLSLVPGGTDLSQQTATSRLDRKFMVIRNLVTLKVLALTLMLPGLAGLVFSAMVSTNYLENLPKGPIPAELRMIPRSIHGTMVYQTVDEDRKLSIMEYSSVTIFLAGLVLGVVYLEKWVATRQSRRSSEAELLEEVAV